MQWPWHAHVGTGKLDAVALACKCRQGKLDKVKHSLLVTLLVKVVRLGAHWPWHVCGWVGGCLGPALPVLA